MRNLFARFCYFALGVLVAGMIYQRQLNLDRAKMYMVASDIGMDAYHAGCGIAAGMDEARDEYCQAGFRLYKSFLDEILEEFLKGL